MKRAGMALVLSAIGGLSLGAVNVQQSSTPATNASTDAKARDNLYFVSGGDTYERATWTGGNILVFVTDRGDPGRHDVGRRRPRPARANQGVTNTPVTTIINTHTHFDHSGSNTEFPATVEFIAHENTRANMAKPTCPPVTNCDAFKGDNASTCPGAPSRTGCRSSVARIRSIFTTLAGGTPTAIPSWFFRRFAPCTPATCSRARTCRSSMSRPTAAARSNSVRRCSRRCATIENVDARVGGHTPTPVTWADFRTFTDFYKEFLVSAQAALKQGTMVDEFVANYRLPEKYAGFKADPARSRRTPRPFGRRAASSGHVGR